MACILLAVFMLLRGIAGLFIGPSGQIASGFSIVGRKIVMEKPKLSGFKRDGSSYEMTANSAIQDLKVPNMVELEQLKARIQTGSDGWADLSAEFGIYDSKAELLDVRGDVRVKTESGTEAILVDAHIELKGGTVITDKPAQVRTNQGQVNSDRMRVIENGKRLVFEGNVRSVFSNPEPQNGAETVKAPAP